MKQNIVLYGRVVFAENLEYEEASGLLDKAQKTPAAQFFDFVISSDGESKWNLEGYPIDARKAFMKNPFDFLLIRNDK